MTREEAITNLKMIRVAFVDPGTKEQRKLIDDTFEMAIQALSQEPTEKPMTVDEMEREYEKSKALFHKIVESDDAISREDAIEAVKQAIYNHDSAIMRLTELPSVTQKSGEWIDHSYDEGYVECPFCEHATTCEDNIDELHYCFFCGARMVEPQESEE